MHVRAILAGLLVLAASVARAEAQVAPPPGPAGPSLTEADRVAIAEAIRVVAAVRDSLWPGWDEVPFALLLVTPDAEFLIGHPRPSDDFQKIDSDSGLGDVLRRARVFPPDLLATFPAVGGFPTIVVGRPEATGKSPTAWVLSVVHEHFHQLQMSRPDYYEGVNSLGLARGDSTGQWMLDYPFPYDDSTIGGRFVELESRLLRSLEYAGSDQFARRRQAYDAARERFREALAPEDYRYFQFQLWQEGVARYTELRAAQVAGTAGPPGAAFQALEGYEPYEDAAARLRREILQGLQTGTLSGKRRIAFYPFGAATALFLDVVQPGWRERYFTEPFTLDPYSP